ncbi:TPA: type II secretion system protein M [Vibrio vulnificus]|uniref:type II secretion system protein M n=1 Tax=Vibrio vulnificus TaxID=672 RepID=UPI001A1A8447|nr:type II secretion system protein M [Vibrio vulnificus]WIL74360.1 type II secretion system protein M [Vibrio vulnificus]HAS6044835.1 type II secretion system protein M [Vibrio vulnificus]HAT8505968.1 type II secretion system protein M [Vibrio vulnificus]
MTNLLNMFQAWWSSISQREQRLVVVCGVFGLIGLIYWGVLQPINARAEQAQLRIQSEKQLLSWVSEKADELTGLRASGGVSFSNQPLNQVIASSARQFKVELQRVQPRNEMLQVWVVPVPFNRLVDWLTFLKEKQGIEVEFMDIDRGKESGLVEVNRLQFKRG